MIFRWRGVALFSNFSYAVVCRLSLSRCHLRVKILWLETKFSRAFRLCRLIHTAQKYSTEDQFSKLKLCCTHAKLNFNFQVSNLVWYNPNWSSVLKSHIVAHTVQLDRQNIFWWSNLSLCKIQPKRSSLSAWTLGGRLDHHVIASCWWSAPAMWAITPRERRQVQGASVV